MNIFLIAFALIILWCIFLDKLSARIGLPSLLLFILFGMLNGWIDNDFTIEDQKFVSNICTFALVFIMFYGGFGTNWKTARPVVVESGILATIGVFLTAGLVGAFCYYVLHWGLAESFLMGAVISSTDAATVFSILRSRNLALKHNTAPVLEIESGSNDPCSYMMTAVMLSVLQGTATGGQVIWMIFSQLVFGTICGLGIAWLAIKVLKRYKLPSGFDMMFFVAVAVMAYGLPSHEHIGGNGYLSTYIVGIVLGNTEFPNRKAIVHFFDGTTSLCQIVIFYCLGYICIPDKLFAAWLPAVLIFAFITLIARPIAVSALLMPFRKYRAHFNQIGLVSFVGLRGAASIVFAIMTLTTTGLVDLHHDIFSTVFIIVLISILLQGSFIPAAAKMFKMTDENSDVMHTFTDFSEDSELSFSALDIDSDSSWANKTIKELKLPKSMLVALIIRGKERIVPKGHTQILSGDKVVISSFTFEDSKESALCESHIDNDFKYLNKSVKEYAHAGETDQILLIKRGNDAIIPDGEVIFKKNDTIVFLQS